ncbi:hypothetical protein ABDK00_014230 [Niabella insulamsoli]|uniref:hypothetical protein n=1 Tax=Niabella insulamsoli TaxID=3144874 RepID=UPI0031FC310B
MENQSLELKRGESLNVETVSVDQIDLLEKGEAAPIDLMSDYWTPVDAGDKKRVLFDRIDIRPVLDEKSGEIIDLECAFFFAKENGAIKNISNGSKRLVGAITAYNIQKGTPLEITYLGKKKNKTNSLLSDNWSIKPLVINIAAK